MRADQRCPEMRTLRPNVRRALKPASRTLKPIGQMEMAFRKTAKATAEEVVQKHLLRVLPPGVPPNFQSIDRAWFENSGRRKVAVAEMTMVDGLRATVEVFRWEAVGVSWGGHGWRNWQGPALYFEGGEWRRDSEVTA
jgi:hypothetical protein